MFSLIAKLRSFLYCPSKHAASESRISVDPKALLMKGCQFAFRYEGGSISVGEESLVGCQFIVEHPEGKIRVGKRCFLNAGTHVIAANEVEIGDDVTMAWGITIYDHNSHSLSWQERVKDSALQNENFRQGLPIHTNKNWQHVKREKIKIGDKAWIGFNATILKGVTIGEGAIVSAGAVVMEDVPAFSVVVGNPAKVVRTLEAK